MTSPQPSNGVDGEYVPTFSARFRKVIYILGVVFSVLGIILGVLSTDLNFPKWASDTIAIMSPILPGIASAFGVHYAGISI